MVSEAAINPLSNAIASMIEQTLAPYLAEVADLRTRLNLLDNQQSGRTANVPHGCLSWQEAKTKQFLSIKQTAFLLGVSDKSVRRKIDDGLIKASKALRHVRIHVDEIDAYRKRTV